MTPSSQTEIAALAEGYANESRGKAKKLLGWTVGLLGASALLVGTGGIAAAGILAGAVSIVTGGYAVGHYRAEKLMRKAASEAGDSDFSEKLKAKTEELAVKNKHTQKWGMIGMVGFVVGLAGALLFPAAAPVLGMVRSLGSMIWGYNSVKSILNDASSTHAASLNEKVRELAQKEAAPLPAANDDGTGALTNAPAPGLAFGIAVKSSEAALDDAPVQKSGQQPSIRL